MSDWGISAGFQNSSAVGSDTATTDGVTVSNPGASLNTKGSWTELVASSGIHAHGIVLSMYISGNTAVRGLVDIGVGGSGSEVVIIPNYPVQRISSNSASSGANFFPVTIPVGSRISARYQHSANQMTVDCGIQLFGAPFNSVWSGTRCATYGPNTGTSKGIAVAAAASANTKGSWFEITASTEFASQYLVLSTLNDGTSSSAHLLDLAVGSSGSEQIIIPDLLLYNVAGSLMSNARVCIPFALPAGVRLAARIQSNNANAVLSTSVTVVGS